jgi:transposase
VSDGELSHKRKPEPARRLEVFTGAGRRRSRTAKHKAQILAASYEGGIEVSAVVRRHGLRTQQLFGRSREGPRPRRESGDDKGDMSGPAFARVVVGLALLSPEPPIAPNRKGEAAVIEIVIVIGTATIRIAHGIDVAMPTTVLNAVKVAI